MNAFASVLSSRRFNNLFPWASAAVLGAGVAVALVTFFPSTTPVEDNLPIGKKPTLIKEPKTVPVPREARVVAGRFVQTAVARQNLAEAWRISSPALKQGMTLKEWMTGNIPVIPYPVNELGLAPMKVDYSYAREIQLKVALLPKDGAKNAESSMFIIVLKKFGKGENARWLVDAWVPHSPPELPSVQ